MKLITLLVLASLPGAIFAGNVKTSLSAAVKDKSITLDAVNFAGHYQGKTTRLLIVNNTKSVVQLTVDMGTILKPVDPGYQPMVLAGEETITIMPHANGEVDVQTFCGNAPSSCPRQNLHYSFDRVGNDTLVKVCRFIKANNLFDWLGQTAVWAITNDHGVEGIYDAEREAIAQKLVDLICSAAGYKKPEYHVVAAPVAQVPDAPAYVPKTLKIVAEFEIILKEPKTMTLGVYDSTGNMQQPVFENQQFGISGHRFNVEFEAENVPAGKYYIRLKEGDAVLKEQMVKVE